MFSNKETNQVHDVKIVRNRPLTQEFQPLGYNETGVIDLIKATSFYQQGLSLDPHFEEEKNKNGRIDTPLYIKSYTKMYGINSTMYTWDPIPELENFPVSGHPNQVAQQYVLYNVEPDWKDRVTKKMHIHVQAKPTAYNSTIHTQKAQEVVYQTPVTTLLQNMSGTTFLQKLKKFLVG